jgi:hypothetical protein
MGDSFLKLIAMKRFENYISRTIYENPKSLIPRVSMAAAWGFS